MRPFPHGTRVNLRPDAANVAPNWSRIAARKPLFDCAPSAAALGRPRHDVVAGQEHALLPHLSKSSSFLRIRERGDFHCALMIQRPLRPTIRHIFQKPPSAAARFFALLASLPPSP